MRKNLTESDSSTRTRGKFLVVDTITRSHEHGGKVCPIHSELNSSQIRTCGMWQCRGDAAATFPHGHFTDTHLCCCSELKTRLKKKEEVHQTKSCLALLVTSVFLPVQRHRGEPGHTRDRHKNLTNQPQNQPLKPTPPRAPPTDSRARPHPNPGTHASHHTTPLTRTRGGGDGDGDGARTWEQRGREPNGIGDGTPPRAGRRGGKRLRHPREADRVHARRQGPGMNTSTRDAALAFTGPVLYICTVPVLDGPCDLCARARPCVPCVPCVSRLPPVSFYRPMENAALT